MFSHVIGWINQTTTEEQEPNAVHRSLGEIGIVGMRRPLRQLLSSGLMSVICRLPAREHWRNDLVRIWKTYLTGQHFAKAWDLGLCVQRL